MTYQEEFITFMVRAGVLTFGDFTTKSGRNHLHFFLEYKDMQIITLYIAI